MPYELKMENDDTAYLRCWGTVTSQHAHDFLKQLYHSDKYSNAKFFFRDYLGVTEILVDPDIPTYAAIYEATALKALNSRLILAIVARDDMVPLLNQYMDFVLSESPSSIVKMFTSVNEAREWLSSQR